MPRDGAPFSGTGSPAEAAALIGGRYRLAPEEAQELVTNGLRSGRVGAVYVSPSGERRPATLADCADRLDFGEQRVRPALIADDGAGGAWRLVIVTGDLEVDFVGLIAYAEAIIGRRTEAAPAKDRGGRPATHDWRLATRQILLRVYEHGLPATKAELVGELLDWFDLGSQEPPDLRTVERFVSAIWPQGRCELRPRGVAGET